MSSLTSERMTSRESDHGSRRVGEDLVSDFRMASRSRISCTARFARSSFSARPRAMASYCCVMSSADRSSTPLSSSTSFGAAARLATSLITTRAMFRARDRVPRDFVVGGGVSGSKGTGVAPPEPPTPPFSPSRSNTSVDCAATPSSSSSQPTCCCCCSWSACSATPCFLIWVSTATSVCLTTSRYARRALRRKVQYSHERNMSHSCEMALPPPFFLFFDVSSWRSNCRSMSAAWDLTILPSRHSTSSNAVPSSTHPSSSKRRALIAVVCKYSEKKGSAWISRASYHDHDQRMPEDMKKRLSISCASASSNIPTIACGRAPERPARSTVRARRAVRRSFSMAASDADVCGTQHTFLYMAKHLCGMRCRRTKHSSATRSSMTCPKESRTTFGATSQR
eukprot:PhM_4_TR11642/c2_g3_i1/m.68232